MVFIGLVDPPSLEKMAGPPSGQLQLSLFFSSCQTDMKPRIKLGIAATNYLLRQMQFTIGTFYKSLKHLKLGKQVKITANLN